MGRAAYRARRLLRHIAVAIQCFGVVEAVRYLALECLFADYAAKVKCRRLSEKIYVRTRSTDLDVFYSIFHRDEYKLVPSATLQNIVDCGSNVGYSCLYLSQLYPNARIVAIEPEHRNYEVLVKNTESIDRIMPVNAAIWSSTGKVELMDRGTGDWGYAIRALQTEATDAAVACVTIDDIVNQYSMERIELLKLDIEGAEKEVLEGSSSWIQAVDGLVAELHDRITPGCSRVFREATGQFEFTARVGSIAYAFRDSEVQCDSRFAA